MHATMRGRQANGFIGQGPAGLTYCARRAIVLRVTAPATTVGIALGLASHVLAGIFPFIAAGAIASLGLMPATALIYAVGTIVLLVALAPQRMRVALLRETRAFWASPRRLSFIGSLLGFLVAGIAYYQGLARSPRIAEYIFLTRLDWVIQAPVAIILLREPWTRGSLAGGVLALAGGIVLAWTGSVGPSGLAAAAIYIAASLMGYVCVKPLAAARADAGAATLTMWRHAVNTTGFLLLAIPVWRAGAAPIDVTGALLVTVGGVVIVCLFLLRFLSLTRIPLWVLAVQAPVQASVAVVASLATEGALPLVTAIAISMVVAGEVVVAAWRPRAA